MHLRLTHITPSIFKRSIGYLSCYSGTV